ncbi:MAG: prepilin peptidase [Micropruina sp.]|uniref:prepilin peptidase n=1 Tax=Micropruina sp. TaxID=2737536 RepID=UPI0039E288DF
MSWLLVLPVLYGASMALATPSLLRVLPAPVDEPDADPYRPLATPGVAIAVFLLVTAAGMVVVTVAPRHTPTWLGLVGPAVLAAVVDARTTYLPRPLAQASLLLTTAGMLATTAWLGAEPLLRGALGALASGALFWLFWRLGGGFGFGDVRLAPVIGAASAAVSWSLLAGALLLGSLLGVAWGVVWRASGRGRQFPYGPALVAGPFLALTASALVPSG